MSAGFTFINWNPQKKRYDAVMLSLMVLYFLIFWGISSLVAPDMTVETLLIRATGTLALLMLHIILLIGPLSRFIPKMKILLYNRRHLGVSMFFVALFHGIFSWVQYHSGGNATWLGSLLGSNTNYFSISQFPFMVLGFLALIILFLMAATSHDFWLKKLQAKVWKRLHMMVYLAYVLLIFHVLLGSIQSEANPWGFGVLLLGAIVVCAAHIKAGMIPEKWFIKKTGEYELVGEVNKIQENRAIKFNFKGHSIAVYKHKGEIYAVADACAHQGGPLSEGKIIEGCITCPWHGWQYRPEDGCSPPPFEEKIKTYPVKVEEGKIWVKFY